MKTEEVTSTLSTSILMMMAGFFDKLDPVGDAGFSEMIVKAAKIVADDIAEKLTLALVTGNGALTATAWKEFVATAAQNACFEFPDDGPRIKLAENASFVVAVETCTAKIVAPRGSAWAQELLYAEDQRLRTYLQSMNVPSKEIKRLVGEWRSREAAAGTQA
jgi:hypothetical protein